MTKTTLLTDKFSLLVDRGGGGCEEKKMTVLSVHILLSKVHCYYWSVLQFYLL